MVFLKYHFDWRILLSPPLSKIQSELLWKQGIKRWKGRPCGAMTRPSSSIFIRRKFSNLGYANTFSTEGHASWSFQRSHAGHDRIESIQKKIGMPQWYIQLFLLLSSRFSLAIMGSVEAIWTEENTDFLTSRFHSGSQLVFPHLYSLFVKNLL